MGFHVLVALAATTLAATAGLLVYAHVASPSIPLMAEGPAPESVPPAETDKPLELDDKEKEYIWDIEHHGNLLSRKGFPALAAALQKGDAQALGHLLAPDFQGMALTEAEASLHTGVLDVVRHTMAVRSMLRLGRDPFVARLLEWRKVFAGDPKVKVSLMALAPATYGKREGPWEGTAQVRLWGEWEKGKPAEVIAYLRYRVPQPTAETLARGGWLSACAITQTQVGKAQRYLFREVAAARGIDPKQFHDNWTGEQGYPVTGGVYACDFNRDGCLDLLVIDLASIYLYQGQPDGRFALVTPSVGLPTTFPTKRPMSRRPAFADLDGDGWEDLILGGLLYRNEQGKRFVEVTGGSLRLPPDCTGIVVADYDRDGRIDLYVTRPGKGKADSWLDGKSGNKRGNVLYRNKGNWQFEDVTEATGTDGGRRSTFSAAWLDVNDDGWPDLHVINEFGDGVLLVNEGKSGPEGAVTFRPRSLSDRPSDFGSMGVAAGDVDNDGRIDLYCANMYSKAGNRVIGNVRPGIYPKDVMARMRRFVVGSQLHHNLGDGRFEQVGQAWQVNDCGWAYGPALADLDNDGWLDLHATCGYISRSRDEPDG